MSWFDEQIKNRKKSDNESFDDALDSIASAVMGRRLSQALSNQAVAQSALEEILKFYHFRIKKDDFPSHIKTIEEQIDYRIRPFGIMRRNVTLENGWYKHAVGAMLGTLKKDGKAVALIPGALSGYYFNDPETGKRTKLNRKTEKMLDGEAVCFYQPLPLRALKISDLLVFMLKQYSISDLVMYIGMAAVMALVGLLAPMFTKWMYGSVLSSGDTNVLISLAVFMICYTLGKLLLSVYQSLINERINIKQSVAVEAAVMSRMLSLPASFFKCSQAGELTQRSSYVQSLCSILMTTIANVGLTSVFSLVYIGQIFQFAPSLVAPSLIVTLATVVLSIITTLVQTKISGKQMEISAATSGLTYSTITGIQKIKLAGAEKRMFARWAKNYSAEAELMYNPPAFIKLSGTISLAISLIGTFVIYYTSVTNGVTMDNYTAFNASYGMISGAFMSLSMIATTIAQIKPTLEMARPILEATPEHSEGLAEVSELKGNIELSNVTFRYCDDMPDVISNLSLKIKAGEYVAIVGKTGCGKSTLLRLLLGFEKPQKGAVYYDKKDITKVDIKSIRRRTGVVMQSGKLFLGDIYSNIVISAPHLTLDDALEAARIASIDEDIRNMPMGMHTIISEGQGGISGGQRQRLMIARAVAAKPKIIMLDEATSALDNVTQKKVSEAIDGLNCTRIVIAHRLSTIKNADRIIYLENGSIAEEGSYEELIAKDGKFAELVKRQRLDIDVD